jgi:hypothetical protein
MTGGANWNTTGGARPRSRKPKREKQLHKSFNGFVDPTDAQDVISEHGGSIKLLRATMSADALGPGDAVYLGLEFGEIACELDHDRIVSMVMDLTRCLCYWVRDEMQGRASAEFADLAEKAIGRANEILGEENS